MQHSDIIDLMGGIRPLAKILGLKHHSIVQGWKSRNSIPLKYIAKILMTAQARKKRLTAEQFLQIGR